MSTGLSFARPIFRLRKIRHINPLPHLPQQIMLALFLQIKVISQQAISRPAVSFRLHAAAETFRRRVGVQTGLSAFLPRFVPHAAAHTARPDRTRPVFSSLQAKERIKKQKRGANVAPLLLVGIALTAYSAAEESASSSTLYSAICSSRLRFSLTFS